MLSLSLSIFDFPAGSLIILVFWLLIWLENASEGKGDFRV
jgi:hypothetical protein